MKKELESVHEERVQTNLNAKKRDATHDFREALATHVASSNKHNVLQKLKVKNKPTKSQDGIYRW